MLLSDLVAESAGSDMMGADPFVYELVNFKRRIPTLFN
jgi:hypothetical protein